MHHPWRAFRDLAHYTLCVAPLPVGVLARTDHAALTVTMAPDLQQVERRCSIEHERQHILDPNASERVVRRRTARVLLPNVHLIGDALVAAPDLSVAADDLWVDTDVLVERLESLHPAERHYLRRRLAEH